MSEEAQEAAIQEKKESFIQENIRLKLQYETLFKQIFGVSLLLYHHPFWGFDVVEFDKRFLKPKHRYPDGQSMAHCVREHYGQGAVDMIRKLIGAKE